MPEVPSNIPSGFEGFVYEPSSEQEVIGIFFAVLQDLNLPICIGEVREGFPDCLAWRTIEDGYERFNIEFELYSQNFREHGHDPEKCDLIVCWEDNWPGSPIEVLQLKEVLKNTDEDLVLLDEPKFTDNSWSEERFFERVEEKYPEILDIQSEIFNTFKNIEELNISMGRGLKRGNYSIHIPSTDYEVRMGIGEDGDVVLDYKGLGEENKEKLVESFEEKLDIRIDSEKEWTKAFWLGEDLKKNDIDKLLEILLEEDFS